jgi:opacity protein-like surface antigen
VKRQFLIPLAAAVGLFASGLAAAQSQMPWEQKFWGYVGANAGQSKFKGDCSSFFDCDRKDSAWNVHLGGNFSQVFGAEIGYTDFGRMRSFGGETEAKAADISLTAGVPLGQHFAIFAKGGFAYGDTDVSASPSTFVSTGSKKEWGSKWGAGATWAFTPNWQLRVDYDRYKLGFTSGDRDIDLLSAGLQYRF